MEQILYNTSKLVGCHLQAGELLGELDHGD